MTASKSQTSIIKSGAVGGEQESGFEQAFSSLAYAYLKDKAPRLIDYIIGFQLVDRNNDNTKAVGVFGFKVGSQWLYAPVFFLNGDLKGHELLYTKSQDAFVPMKENWVNYLMSRKPHVLGEGSERDVRQLGGLQASLEQMTFPPNFSKMSADNKFKYVVKEGLDRGADRVDTWAKPAVAMIAAGILKRARFLFGVEDRHQVFDMQKVASNPMSASLAGLNMDLEEFLGCNINLLKGAYRHYESNPSFKQAIDRLHDGPSMFVRIGKEIREKAANIVDSILVEQQTKQASDDSILGTTDADDKAKYTTTTTKSEEHKVDPTKKVKVWTKDAAMTLAGVARLSEEQRSKIAQRGYLVEDERSGDEVSVPYKTQTASSLTNPGETDLYQVLEAPGEFAKMLVLSAPISNKGNADFSTIIRMEDTSADSRSFINAHPTAIWIDQAGDEDSNDNDFKSWFEDLGDKKPTKGGMFVAVTASGKGTVPFKVTEVYDDGEAYKVDFKCNQSYEHDRAAGLPQLRDDDAEYGPYISPYDAKLGINRHNGTEFRAAKGELFVPAEAKFIQIAPPPTPKKEDNCDGCCIMSEPPYDSNTEYGEDPTSENDKAQSENRPIEPGSIDDIHMLFMKKTAAMKLYGDQSEVTIYTEKRGHERHTWQNALFALVRDHGLSEKSASDLLKEAQVKNGYRARIKYAFPYPLQESGPSAPAFPAPNTGTEPMGYNQVNSIYPQEELLGVPGLEAGLTDPSVYDPFITPDQNAMQTAQQAAGKGQKEVFDVSVISGMLKAVRQDSLVDRYLGDLMKALDRLGRILFLFYWHGEEFEDRYGKSDLIELEDSLRNAFESLGEIVLFLKEKSIEAPTGDDDLGAGLEEVARN